MSDIRISVIIPVYNVKDYIARAIESIQSQTMGDWELLLVDDGSSDGSGDICDSYAASDDRIKVLHQKNGGAPAARNSAIPLAKGKYLYFMDGDDWCESCMLKEMYELAEEHNAQYLVCGYYIDTWYGEGPDDYYRQVQAPDGLKVYTSARDFREDAHIYFDRNLLYTPWNKLYLASVIHDNALKFPDTKWDDFPFNLSVMDKVDRVVVSPRCYYHFLRARSESESESYNPGLYAKREEEHGWMLALYRRWNETTNPGITRNKGVREFISRRYIERLFGCFENLTNHRGQKRTAGEIRLAMDEILANPRVDVALKYARPGSVYMKLMLVPVRLHNSRLLYWEAIVISIVKTRFIRLFATLKSHR